MAWQEVYVPKNRTVAYIPEGKDTEVFELDDTQAAEIWYLLAHTLMGRGERVIGNYDDDEYKNDWYKKDYTPFKGCSTPDLLKLFKIFERAE